MKKLISILVACSTLILHSAQQNSPKYQDLSMDIRGGVLGLCAGACGIGIAELSQYALHRCQNSYADTYNGADFELTTAYEAQRKTCGEIFGVWVPCIGVSTILVSACVLACNLDKVQTVNMDFCTYARCTDVLLNHFRSCCIDCCGDDNLEKED